MTGAAPLVKRALDWAATQHHGQARKYPGVHVPYMSHIAGVVARLARHGFDDIVLAAGALHDTVEDTGTSYEEITALFGAPVAELVRHTSEEDKSLPWEERKARYLERFPAKPWEAQAITLADKIDNLESIAVCAALHGDPWAMLKRGRDVQISRFDALLEAARALPPHPLVDELARAIDAVRAL
ncbi:MAG: bifunctional (p)ppGpp synthetase/guanosine-3',5'-bis(diphosphate) 3'-pyrophosphohydrolase [Myxococcales bacterium]|nr:bifunctional (p)ppGpp synthetase/guanosine-3',5'-bis(diphosphate) 3'-pyrophosphohydrolase [Myxococcales bacterium]